ncbi:MAG: D-alanyl-D-alanine carboxypeptidase/D-alanyl-D-alanine endopeptidase [Vulcanimicrobiaceae bacterium]
MVLALASASFAHRRSARVVALAPRPAAKPAAARLMAAPAWSASERAALQRAVHAALSPALEGAGAWSCVVLSQDGKVVYNDRAQHAVMPASTQKLIAASAALNDLGPSYRFHTLFASGEPPASSGRLDGDLWFVGSGDPSLRSDDVRGGIKRLETQGVHAIDGSIVVDASAIAGKEINPLWNTDDSNEDFEAATSGISLDEDTVEFEVTGTAPGAAAQVRVEPPSSAITYSGSVQTSGAGGDDVIIAATQTPNHFRVDGAIPPGVTEKYYVPVHGIPQYVGSVLARMLKERGIAQGTMPRTGITPLTTRVLWNHRSRPLHDLVRDMLFRSDNHYAEQLMRVVGGLDGAAATDASGVAAERNYLHARGVRIPGLHIVDGSGLSHANRVAAITLASILSFEQRDPQGNPIYSLLPRGGFDGTLKNYRFGSALGRVRAKSGHLSDVDSLAGYVTTHGHGRLTFAFLVNDSPGDPDDAIVAAVDRLSEF